MANANDIPAPAVLAWLVNALAVSAAVLTAAVIVNRRRRDDRPAARVAVWRTALAVAVAAPAVMTLLPAGEWAIPLAPADTSAKLKAVPPAIEAPVDPAPTSPAAASEDAGPDVNLIVAAPGASPTAATPTARPRPRPVRNDAPTKVVVPVAAAVEPTEPSARLRAEVHAKPQAAEEIRNVGAVKPQPSVESPSPVPTAASDDSPAWPAALAGVWAAAAATLTGGTLLQAVRLRRLRRRSVAVPRGSAVHDDLREVCRRLGLKHAPRLLSSDALSGPVAFGVLRPTVIVPAGFADAPAEVRRAALAHEAAHLAHGDPLWNWLASLAAALCWFQPLVWMVRRRMRQESEFVCDEAAAGAVGDGVGLASYLAGLADSFRRPDAACGAAHMAEFRSQLGRRIERLLSIEPAPPAPRRKFVRSAGAVALVASLGLFGPRAVWREAAAGGAEHTEQSEHGGTPMNVKNVLAASLATALAAGLPGAAGADNPAKPAPAARPADKAGDRDARDLAVAKALATVKPELKLEEVPLKQALEFIRDQWGVKMFVHTAPLSGIGVDMEGPVSLQLTDVSLETAMGLLLDQVGAQADPHQRPTYVVESGLLIVSTADDLKARQDRKLRTPLPILRLRDMPLEDVFDSLRDRTGATIVVNWKALKEGFGIEPSSPVSVQLKNVSLDKAIQVMLDSVASAAGRKGDSPVIVLDEGFINVTTKAQLERRTRSYRSEELPDGDINNPFAGSGFFGVPAPAPAPVAPAATPAAPAAPKP